MIIQDITLRQFRCFEERQVAFNGRVVVIEGPNGSGKSSIMEALHYCCYLRSFRTHLNRDLVQLGQDFFFIDVGFNTNQSVARDTIQVGFSRDEGKVVKSNQKVVQSYKELIDNFRIITLAADDMALVNGGPDLRREFLNYAILLNNPGLLPTFKKYKQVLEHRNKLLFMGNPHQGEFEIWSKKLWDEALIIREERITYLKNLEISVNVLLKNFFSVTDSDLSVSFEYQPKQVTHGQEFSQFWLNYQKNSAALERDWRRSLFGTHLDDFSIVFQNKRARIYASRGQQKLLVLLIKIAQLQELSLMGEPGVLLLDDFMTDFDHTKIACSFAALNQLQFQMFLSCPISPQAFLAGISKDDVCHIIL